jgi:PAS domain-containing protein
MLFAPTQNTSTLISCPSPISITRRDSELTLKKNDEERRVVRQTSLNKNAKQQVMQMRGEVQHNDCIPDDKSDKGADLEGFLHSRIFSNESMIASVVTSASYPFHIEWANKSWCNLFGWSAEEILGKSSVGFTLLST